MVIVPSVTTRTTEETFYSQPVQFSVKTAYAKWIVLMKGSLSLHTRKILCILMVAEQKMNLVRSKRRNSSPKNWRKAWSAERKKVTLKENLIKNSIKARNLWGNTWNSCAFLTQSALSFTQAEEYKKQLKEKSAWVVYWAVGCRRCRSLTTYLWSGNESAAGQYPGWFF